MFKCKTANRTIRTAPIPISAREMKILDETQEVEVEKEEEYTKKRGRRMHTFVRPSGIERWAIVFRRGERSRT